MLLRREGQFTKRQFLINLPPKNDTIFREGGQNKRPAGMKIYPVGNALREASRTNGRCWQAC